MPARGPKVFGWDAVFEPIGYDMTCARPFSLAVFDFGYL